MRTALVTTTVNIPNVLKLYAQCDPGVKMFVAGDIKTPLEAAKFCDALPNCVYLAPEAQSQWKCSELLGWNTDSRRNIALLEAVRQGAEIIASIDDDMLPCSLDFFESIEHTLTAPYSGLQMGRAYRWCDVGEYTQPKAAQRGLPVNCSPISPVDFVLDAQVGAMQGIILGIPDTDAVTMQSTAAVHSATDILRNGFVVHPEAKAVFNSQFTAFRRELAPCFAQFYKWQGRNTDIMASLVMRRVMREKNLYTYFGPPTGYHARSSRDPLKDIRAELWGLERVTAFSAWLDAYLFFRQDDTPLTLTRHIWDGMADTLVPRENIDAALAFLEDMEPLL